MRSAYFTRLRRFLGHGQLLTPFSGIFLFLLTALLLTTPTFAQQPPSNTPASPDPATLEARKYYQQGAAAAKKQDWEAAYEAFAKAWKYKKHWQISANLGRAAFELKKCRRAAEHLAIFLREIDPEIPEEERAQAKTWLAECRSRIGALTIVVPESDREILVDSSPVGMSPLAREVFIDPGKHEVSTKLDGCAVNENIEIAAGETRKLTLRCAPAQPMPAVFFPRIPLAIAGGGLSVVGVGLGAVAAVMSTRQAELQNEAIAAAAADGGPSLGQLGQIREMEHVKNLWANTSVGAFVVGAVALVGTGTMLILTRDPDPPKSDPFSRRTPPLEVRVSAGPGGVAVSGRW